MATRPRPAPAQRPGIRARTRALLLEAAARVFAEKGVGGTAIHEIAAAAGVANGTFYNYFRTREEVAEAVAGSLVGQVHVEITASYRDVADPAERMAIGCRRFLGRALDDASSARAMLRVWASTETLPREAVASVAADLRAGKRRGRFRYRSEVAALDLIQGAVLAGMRSVLEGRAGPEHPAAVAALVLRGLGVEAAEADALVRRALPAPAGPRRRARPSA
ncbi:MAG: TetR/AcrR family transcriptional regulator [bacterium]|nr:TetR/AcrR family transcriptional regulator [bacterium]